VGGKAKIDMKLRTVWFAFVYVWTCLQGESLLGQFTPSSIRHFSEQRERLIQEILIPNGISDTRVLQAIRQTDRHEFVLPEHREQAYFDFALPIGSSQTISSPYIVAVMTQELDVQEDHKVLEIGTGSGYQAAVLSPLAREVYSIEIVEQLGQQARRVIESLGYSNVFTKIGDGFLGWPEHAPFDRIIVTCSPESVPQPLVEQLSEGGLMIIPVGERYQQMLYLMRKKDGQLHQEALKPTLFVPMTGKAEESRQILADPANPKLLNEQFDDNPLDSGDIPGWYYQRGLTWRRLSEEPARHGIEFENDVPGRPTHLLQGLAMDGRMVPRVRLSTKVMAQNIRPGLDRTELPTVALRLYDENRDLLQTHFLGPFSSARGWREENRIFRIPLETREAIVSVGLFGATGKAVFDYVSLEAVVNKAKE
jgi:protein-L-isoaspartate(D-aspartate) O-methyltransferase